MPSQEQADKREKYLDPEYSERVAERYIRNANQGRVALGGQNPRFSENPANPRNSKISKTTFYEMLVVAVFFDLVSLIPILGTISDIGALLIFYIWYKICGVSFSNPKRSLSFFGTAIIEAIPLLDMLPTWTVEVIYMYTLENKEVLLGKVASAGGVAGVSSVAGGALKLTRAKDAGNALKQTSQKAQELQSQIRARQINPREKFEEIKRPENEQFIKGLQKNKTDEPTGPDLNSANQAKIQNEKATPFKRDLLR